MTSPLQQRLEEQIASFDLQALAATISAETGDDVENTASRLRTYIAESRVALRLSEQHLRPGMRILEFGSGVGFFAGFLHAEGYDVVELEPVGQGFDFIGAARQALHTTTGPTHLDLRIEDIDPERHGRFDLIYSLNVLEHVDSWPLALDSAYRVLEPRGKLIVSCPNYSVPYEPHLGIPLVPLRPELTARLLPARVTETGLWKSLNWVTCGQVRRWAEQREASITFERGLLARVSNRLNDDPEFRKRHGTLLRAIARALRVTRADRALAALPPAMVTPMEFVVEPR